MTINADVFETDLEMIDNNTERISNFAGKLKQESSNKINNFNGNIQLGYEIIEGLTARRISADLITTKKIDFSSQVFNFEGNLEKLT